MAVDLVCNLEGPTAAHSNVQFALLCGREIPYQVLELRMLDQLRGGKRCPIFLLRKSCKLYPRSHDI